MELSGEEKKIQALFSELKSADEETAPQFARVWNRAALKPRRAFVFSPAFVAAIALVLCAVVSLAVWSRYRQPIQPQVVRVETPAAPATPNTIVLPPVEPTVAPPSTPSKENTILRRQRTTARQNSSQLAANRKLTRDAKAITNWESPTSALLSSSSDEIFSSLPQFNQSTSDLKSFLPSRPN